MTSSSTAGNGSARYDLVLTGGTLLDPGQGINDRRDVAFKDGVVAKVAPRIDPSSAARSVDVTGKLVTPGLIDIHGHFYHGGVDNAADADEVCLSAGVTTGIDGGSAGWANYRAMRDYVFPTRRTRLLAFLHIGAIGLVLNPVVGGELQDVRYVDTDRTADTIKDNPGFLLGVKVRMYVNSMPPWEAHRVLKQAREAADKAGVKLMVHVSGTPIPLPDILEVLGPGDIATHIFNGRPENILDKRDMIRPEVKEAAQRGGVMDVADAGVHCDAVVARAALDQGLFPTTISTDIHIAPPGRTVYRQNDLVSKFHAMGMPLEDAIAASTSRSAKVLGMDGEIGSLVPGMSGDAAVFEQREGRFVWHDMAGHNVDGSLRLDTHLTVRGGQVAYQEGRLLAAGEC